MGFILIKGFFIRILAYPMEIQSASRRTMIACLIAFVEGVLTSSQMVRFNFGTKALIPSRRPQYNRSQMIRERRTLSCWGN
jgi:hypothetical protein